MREKTFQSRINNSVTHFINGVIIIEHVSTRRLMDKLGVRPMSIVSVIGIKDRSFWQLLIDSGADAIRGRLRPESDLIFLAADSLTALQKLDRLKNYIKPNGAIWVVSLKGKAAKIKDVDVIGAAKRSGLVDNKVVSFSETHTSLRLVIPISKR
jgi:hypothetical protein